MRAQEFGHRNNPAPVYYFAYGMLTDPKNMPGCQAIGAARLHNHRLEFYQYADVEEHAGSEVQGVLWSLPINMLSQLDQVEGVPYLYNRKTMPVTVGGQRYEAYVYTMTPQARQQVQNRAPSTSYLRTLARGYIQFGLPNRQLHSAIQRASRPESELAEVAMNPGAFAASAQQAADRGVLVGYEFEVLVPKASVKAWRSTQQAQPAPAEPDLDQLLGDQTIAAVLKAIRGTHDRYYQFNQHINIFKTANSNSAVNEYLNYIENNPALMGKYVTRIKTVLQDPRFDSTVAIRQATPSVIREKFIRKFKRETGYNLNSDSTEYPDNFLEKARDVCRHYYFETSSPIDRVFRKLKEWPSNYIDKYQKLETATGANNFSKWAKNTYGTDILRDLLANGTWKFAKANNGGSAKASRRLLISMLDPTYVNPDQAQRRSRDRGLYDQATEMINAVMSPAFGNMTVFDSYHESRKKLDRWYIEPDGSLEPNDGDTSCEIVGPPTPAAKAMQDLRSFYSLANSLKLYTNSSTGLHVNVSVPDSLDVLKLAVFLGDQYVLASFGRENSRYAASVLKQLQQASFKPGDFSKTKQQMDRLVKSVSGDHFASINWNGKYVSFRQAGGDYLNNPQMIENTVGRFIRAMVIASDPGAYQQEYMKKLAAMAPQQPGQATQVDSRITARANGLWVIERSVAIMVRIPRSFDATGFLKMDAERRGGYGKGYQALVTANSAEAKATLLAATGLKTKTLEKLRNLPVANFFHITIVSKSMQPAGSGPGAAFGIYDDYDKIGVAVDQKRLLKPTDPAFATALKTLSTSG